MREVSVETFRQLSKSQNLEAGMDAAYSSLKRAYARREIELLQVMQALDAKTDDPEILKLVIEYAKRIVSDPNFIEAMQSSEFLKMKLEALPKMASTRNPLFNSPHDARRARKAVYEALAKVFNFYPGQHMEGNDESKELIFDLNLLQHMPHDPLSPVVKPTKIKFVDSFKSELKKKKEFEKVKRAQDKKGVLITPHRAGHLGKVPSKKG